MSNVLRWVFSSLVLVAIFVWTVAGLLLLLGHMAERFSKRSWVVVQAQLKPPDHKDLCFCVSDSMTQAQAKALLAWLDLTDSLDDDEAAGRWVQPSITGPMWKASVRVWGPTLPYNQ